ncbi:hypothetical protein [Nocardia australiensis]|uniref:hypothetical protein n=1 Tax=Nocardia australiensis TaxID=2887191 RepID=UPI001D156E6D|nr:hypothetical protein [Nocardia australiensis]
MVGLHIRSRHCGYDGRVTFPVALDVSGAPTVFRYFVEQHHEAVVVEMRGATGAEREFGAELRGYGLRRWIALRATSRRYQE